MNQEQAFQSEIKGKMLTTAALSCSCSCSSCSCVHYPCRDDCLNYPYIDVFDMAAFSFMFALVATSLRCSSFISQRQDNIDWAQYSNHHHDYKVEPVHHKHWFNNQFQSKSNFKTWIQSTETSQSNQITTD